MHSFPSYEDDDEDLCPTCLEEYTYENPRIELKCSHNFHRGCIYEWKERSELCPVCGKLWSSMKHSVATMLYAIRPNSWKDDNCISKLSSYANHISVFHFFVFQNLYIVIFHINIC